MFIVLLPAALSLIPVAALAALLVYTGIQLTKLHIVSVLRGEDRAATAIYAVTLATVVGVDLQTGIVVGIGLVLAKLLYLCSHLKVTVEEKQGTMIQIEDEWPKTGRAGTNTQDPRCTISTVIHLKGGATFMCLPRLAKALREMRKNTYAQVYFDELAFIDRECLDWLINWDRLKKAARGVSVLHWEGLEGIFHQQVWTAIRGPDPTGANNFSFIENNDRKLTQKKAMQR